MVLPLALALFAASPAPASPAAPVQTKIAISDFEAGAGIDPKVTHVLSSTVTSEMRRNASLIVVSQEDIRSLLGYEKQKKMLNCTDTGCLAEIGGALGAEQIVTGSLAVLGQTYVFTLRRVDVRKARVLRDVERRGKASSPDELLNAVPGMVRDLFPAGKALSDDAVGASVTEVHRAGPAPWIVAAGGGAVAVAGLVMLLVAVSGAHVNGNMTTNTYPQAQGVNTLGDVGQGVLIGGAAVAVGGIVWGLARPSGDTL